jgi:hypothetical protein
LSISSIARKTSVYTLGMEILKLYEVRFNNGVSQFYRNISHAYIDAYEDEEGRSLPVYEVEKEVVFDEGDQKYYLVSGVVLLNVDQNTLDKVRAKAMAKLSHAEKNALGLPV